MPTEAPTTPNEVSPSGGGAAGGSGATSDAPFARDTEGCDGGGGGVGEGEGGAAGSGGGDGTSSMSGARSTEATLMEPIGSR